MSYSANLEIPSLSTLHTYRIERCITDPIVHPVVFRSRKRYGRAFYFGSHADHDDLSIGFGDFLGICDLGA